MLLINKIFPFLSMVFPHGISISFFEEEGEWFSSSGKPRKGKDNGNSEGNDEDDDGDDLNSFDREKLLEDFLGELEDAEVTPGESKSNLPEIYNLTPDDYPEVEIPEESKERIDELRKIAESIEQKKHKLEYVSKELVKGDYRIDYGNHLNEAQLTAATTTQGPLLVIAGAGSGKTRVIVYRVSYLLENNVDPGRILLLTFTRKAAHEMLTRVEQLLKDTDRKSVV